MMGNCKDCKHWADKAWDEGERISVIDQVGRAWCLRFDSVTDEGTNPEELAVIRVADYQLGEPKLRTHGDFGCVLFEAKEVR